MGLWQLEEFTLGTQNIDTIDHRPPTIDRRS